MSLFFQRWRSQVSNSDALHTIDECCSTYMVLYVELSQKGRAETDIELTVVDQPFHCLIIFVGYVFTSKDHIRPYLENAETGPSIQWAKAQGNNNPSPNLHKNITHLHEIKQ